MDWAALEWIQSFVKCRFLDFAMPWITHMGDGGAVWIIAAVGLIFSKKYRKYGIILFAALAVGFLTGNVWLKPWIARPRPCWITNAKLLISTPKDYSFPSGHTLSSVIGAFVLTAANRKFGFAAIPAAVLIAFSRMYLYVHFPSDVAVSVMIGTAIGAAAVYTLNRIMIKNNGIK